MAAVTASTASLNASALCAAGARKPLTLRTYCSAAACMSSSVTRSAYGARNVLMLLHMTRPYAAPRSCTGGRHQRATSVKPTLRVAVGTHGRAD